MYSVWTKDTEGNERLVFGDINSANGAVKLATRLAEIYGDTNAHVEED